MSQSNGNQEPLAGNFMTISKHELYYIPSADLSILVDQFQFKVHRYFFERESKFFASKLATPVTPGSSLPGLDDPNAIILEHVTPEHFAAFLWVFYNPKYSIYEAPIEKWAIILTLSTKWSFPEVKSLSIRELEKKIMPDVKRIKLYHENNVDRNILIPRYAALIEREDPPTLEECYDLGMETVSMIYRGREEARSARQANGARSPSTPTIHGADLHKVIRDLFKIAPSDAATKVEPTVPDNHNSTGALQPATGLPRTEQPATEQPTAEQPPTKQPPMEQAQKGTQKPAQKPNQPQTTKKGVQKTTEQPPTPQKSKAAPTTTTGPKNQRKEQETAVKEEKENKSEGSQIDDVNTKPLVPVEGSESITATVPPATSDLLSILDNEPLSISSTTPSAPANPTSSSVETPSLFDDLGSLGGGSVF